MSASFRSVILFSSLSALLFACGAKDTTPLPEISVKLTPETAKLLVGTTAQFWATVLHAPDRKVTWSLSGAGCAGDSCGTISSTGLYTAPPTASVLSPLLVTVKAAAAADTSKSASASITIFQPDVVEWTWISGSDLGFPQSDFGTLRLSAPSNVPPGRRAAECWLDPSGNLWLFGGESRDPSDGDGDLNDLWKFDPATLEWTWMSGSMTMDQPGVYGVKGLAAPTNVPGARIHAVSGSDPRGGLWLFGGLGYDSVGRYDFLNDLWKFDLETLEWTWVSGSDMRDQPGIYGTQGIADPVNVPGARAEAVSWFDAVGNLWIFGGIGHDSEDHVFALNDLWKFDTATLAWTWVSGSNVIAQPGVYGTQNIPSPSNVPGARYFASSGIDPGGHLWLFGGHEGARGFLNDLWKFDPATGQWTWVSGSDSAAQPGNYGTKYLPDPANIPGARLEPAIWFDAGGVLWLFGGDGTDATSHWGGLSDLWKFDPVRLEWAWVSGSDSLSLGGTYGTKGQADPLNMPGSRYSALSWFDSQGRFWLFGGSGIGSTEGGYLNDLWRFVR
jgi:N-acetylneuraminic acid mutarotase